MNTLTREDVADLHRKLTTTKTANAADKAVKLLRRMLSWAKISPNPASGAVTFHGDAQCERFLTREEMGRLFNALDAAPNQTIADAIRFMLLTGARRGNVFSARWDQIHLDSGVWIIPRDQSKNGKPMTIALTPAAVELLQTRQSEKDKAKKKEASPWVFPGHLLGQPLKDITKAWDDIRTKAKIADVRIHDLRHTVASWLAMSGASLLVIGKQLGHANKNSTARYAHLELDSVRPALEAAQAMMKAGTLSLTP